MCSSDSTRKQRRVISVCLTWKDRHGELDRLHVHLSQITITPVRIKTTPSGAEASWRYSKEREEEEEEGELGRRYKSWIFGTLCCCFTLAGIMDWPHSQCVFVCVCFCLTSVYVRGVFCQKVLRGDMAFVSGRSAGAQKQGWHLPPPNTPTHTHTKPHLLC